MADYDPIAPFYDTIHGSRRETIRYLKPLLKAYHPEAKTLLSLACGTGAICEALRKRYHVTGLDIAPGMLAVARKKLPRVTFIEGDMTQFELGRSFDVITCLFASLNHVLEFTEWERVFSCVKAHLAPGGIFIFDILTELCLLNMVLNSPIVTRHRKLVSVGDIRMAGERGEGTVWQVKGFHVTRREQQILFETEVRQMSFAIERIQAALVKHFDQVVIEDPEQGEVNERSEVLYFVCS